MKSLRIELERVGIKVIGADSHIFLPDKPIEYDTFEVYELDKEVDIVVSGMDNEFTYSKLAIAALYVNEQKCKLVATNDDIYINVNGRRFPCAGTILASLMLSITNKDVLELIGKPNPYTF
jgi:ribonucleotide monophosphatase NagD (HAD superfamily)